MSYENVPKNLTEKAILTREGRPDFSKTEAASFPVPSADEAGALLKITDTGIKYRWSGTAWFLEHALTNNLNNDSTLVREGKPDYIKLAADLFPTPTVAEAGAILENSDTGDRFRWASTVWFQTQDAGRTKVLADIVGTVPVQTELTKTAFSEVKAEENTAVTQLNARYGLLDLTLTVTDAAASGTNTVVNDLFTCQTGVSATGLASILSLRQLSARAGQGAIQRIDAMFTAGVANSQQAAGLITSENSYVFAFLGTSFGIAHTHGGVSESQTLTITTAAAGAEVATITVDGTAFNVNLTAGTVQHNAFEIAVSLTAQVPNYSFSSNDDEVVAQSLLSGVQGAFAFSSSTAVATWAQDHAGLTAVLDFTAQAAWDVDTRLTGTVEQILDPTKLNWYQIQLCSNAGLVRFYIEDSDTGAPILVHTIKAANLNTLPNVTNPTWRLGWLVQNLGNTTNLTCAGSETGGFIEGRVKVNSLPRAEENDQLAVGTTLTNIIAFRNRLHFGDKVNRAEILPLLVTLSTQTNKSAFFEIIANPVFGGDLDFSYVDEANSIMEVALDAVTVSGGRLLGAFTVVAGNAQLLNFNERVDQDFVSLPGGIFVIASRVSSGAAADMQATSSWKEDL